MTGKLKCFIYLRYHPRLFSSVSSKLDASFDQRFDFLLTFLVCCVDVHVATSSSFSNALTVYFASLYDDAFEAIQNKVPTRKKWITKRIKDWESSCIIHSPERKGQVMHFVLYIILLSY